VTEPRYAFFDHTGDFGVDVTAPSRPEVVAAVARAFLTLLTDDPDAVAEREERALSVEGLDPADALVAFGNELLYLFEVEGFLCARFEVDVCDDDAIEGTARGEPYDPERHPIARPVKAVTHHAARFDDAPGGGAEARLIFDL